MTRRRRRRAIVYRAAAGLRATALTGRGLARSATLFVGRLLRAALVLASCGLILGRRVLGGRILTTSATLALACGRRRGRPLS